MKFVTGKNRRRFDLDDSDFPTVELLTGETVNGDPKKFLQGNAKNRFQIPENYGGTSNDPYLAQAFIAVMGATARTKLMRRSIATNTGVDSLTSLAVNRSIKIETPIRIGNSEQWEFKETTTADYVMWMIALRALYAKKNYDGGVITAEAEGFSFENQKLMPVPEVLARDKAFGLMQQLLAPQIQRVSVDFEYAKIFPSLNPFTTMKDLEELLETKPPRLKLGHHTFLSVAADQGSVAKAMKLIESLPRDVIAGLYPNR